MIWSDIFDSKDDIIFAGKHSDTLSSFNGNDILFAGRGDDRIIVGERVGNVFVSGGRGYDTLTVMGNDDDFQIQIVGKTTLITTDEMHLIVRGIEQIDWIF